MVKKENLDKLSQLDRIEFRQRERECYFSMSLMHELWYIFIISIILLVGGYDDASSAIMVLMIYVFILQIVLMIICPIITKIKQRKLIEEYFEVEVKAKGKK